MQRFLKICLLVFGIAALAFLLWPKVDSEDGARPVAARIDINGGINSTLGQCKLDNSEYPKSLQDLLVAPANANNWHGPYLDPTNWPVDPWGNKYRYKFPGEHNTNAYDLASAGPDGRPGTKDDIGNW